MQLNTGSNSVSISISTIITNYLYKKFNFDMTTYSAIFTVVSFAIAYMNDWSFSLFPSIGIATVISLISMIYIILCYFYYFNIFDCVNRIRNINNYILNIYSSNCYGAESPYYCFGSPNNKN
jgi:hypothetical protein